MRLRSGEVRDGIDPGSTREDSIGIEHDLDFGERLWIRLYDDVMNWHDDVLVDVIELLKSPTTDPSACPEHQTTKDWLE